MKIIKGNFSEKNKVTENKNQESKNQFLNPLEEIEVSYSAMLIDLIRPYMEPEPDVFELEDKVQLGIVA